MEQNNAPDKVIKKSLPTIRDVVKQDKKFLSKYALLFATVSGFLAITTAFGGLGYKISLENKQNGQLLNAVGLEKTLSQQVSKEILALQKEWRDSKKFNTQSLDSLESAKKNFDALLKAFKSGGTVQYGNQTYTLHALNPEDYAESIEKIENSWSPLRAQIGLMSKAYQDYAALQGKMTERDKFLATRKTFTVEVQFGKDKQFPNEFVGTSQQFNAPAISTNGEEALGAEITKTSNTYSMYAADLLTSVEKLNDSINEKIGNKDTSNIQIQMLMSALSLLLFFVLTFYFIRKNIVSDFVIFSEDREKKAILDNINEGLFLMDPDWVIQSEGSKFLHLLFNRKIPAGTNFRKLLSSSVDKETMDNAERFVSVLINKNIKGSMIDSLNPLKLISLNLKDTMNQNIVKHVSVHFGKIYDINGKLKHLLVGVVDSTEKHKLSMSLKEEIRKNKEAFSQLILIGKSQHREEIKNLMSSLFDYLSGINNRFKAGLLKSKEYQEVIREMKNSIHGFKNDAGLLEVDIIQKLLHDLEDYLIALDKSGNITSESFLNMPYQLKELFEAIDVINLLMGSGAQPSPQENAGQQDAEQPRSATIDWIKQSLSMAVEKTSKKVGKPIRFGMGFPETNPQFLERISPLRESLVHLVKNSIIHGLETPSTREAAGKNQVGQLIVQGSINATMMKIKVRDDGAGINREAVQRKGIEKGLIAEGEELSQQQANELIFDPGFSTAEEVDFDAGRGVGLDQVRRAVTKLGGTITVASAEGKGTEFEITIPL